MNNNQLNIPPDWAWVLGRKDLLCYFSVTELKKLSYLCRNLRNQFKPILFNNLNLYYFDPKNIDFLNHDNIVNLSTYGSPIDEFQLYFNQFIPYIFGLEFGSSFNDSMLLTIPIIFQNLKYLKLCQVVISLRSLFQLTHKLNSLESLSLHALTILVWLDKEPSLIQFKFPESLKQLDILRCTQLTSKYNHALLNENNLKLFHSDHTRFCHFPGQFLPYLEEFIIEEVLSARLMQNEFLLLNPQLKSLQTRFELLNQTSFNCLKHLQHLTHIQVYYCLDSLEQFNQSIIPTLNYIKKLEFMSNDQNTITSMVKLSLSCPNTTHLTVPFIQGFTSSLNEIVLELQHLEVITIVGHSRVELFFDLEILWTQLKYIELQRFDPLNIDLTKFESCTELKRVTIKLSRFIRFDMDQVRSHFNNIGGWNCMFFHESIQCYKM